MHRDQSEWALMSPHVVATEASPVACENVLRMAQKDIAEQANTIEYQATLIKQMAKAIERQAALIETLTAALGNILDEVDQSSRDPNFWWSVSIHDEDIVSARIALAAARKGE